MVGLLQALSIWTGLDAHGWVEQLHGVIEKLPMRPVWRIERVRVWAGRARPPCWQARRN